MAKFNPRKGILSGILNFLGLDFKSQAEPAIKRPNFKENGFTQASLQIELEQSSKPEKSPTTTMWSNGATQIRKSSSFSNIVIFFAAKIVKTANQVSQVKDAQGKWFKKNKNIYSSKIEETNAKRESAQIEAVASEFYGFMMNNSPEVRVGINRRGQVNASYSKEVEGYRSLQELSEEKQNIVVNQDQFASWLVTNYIMEENDANVLNIGIDKHNNLVAIDHDQALWPLTSNYAGFAPDRHYSMLPCKPKDSFTISQRDIAGFPNLTDANPSHWITNPDYVEHLRKLGVEFTPELRAQCYKHFTKAIAIAEPFIDSCVARHMNSKQTSYELRSRLTEHLNERFDVLRKTLLSTPEYREYLLKNPQVKNELLAEIRAYNQKFSGVNAPLGIGEQGSENRLNGIFIEAVFQELRAKISDPLKPEQENMLRYFAEKLYFRHDSKKDLLEGINQISEETLTKNVLAKVADKQKLIEQAKIILATKSTMTEKQYNQARNDVAQKKQQFINEFDTMVDLIIKVFPIKTPYEAQCVVKPLMIVTENPYQPIKPTFAVLNNILASPFKGLEVNFIDSEECSHLMDDHVVIKCQKADKVQVETTLNNLGLEGQYTYKENKNGYTFRVGEQRYANLAGVFSKAQQYYPESIIRPLAEVQQKSVNKTQVAAKSVSLEIESNEIDEHKLSMH